MKACKKCGGFKLLDEFPLCRKARDGRTGECKPCRNARCNSTRQARSLTVVAPGRKLCIRCSVTLPIDAFGRQNSQRDGHRNVCKACFTQTPCRRAAARQTARSKEARKRGKVYRTISEWRDHQRLTRLDRRVILSRRAPRSHIISDHPDRELARLYRNLLYRVYTYPRTAGYQRLRVKKYKNAHPDRVALWSDRRWRRIAEQQDGSVSGPAVSALYGDAAQCLYCGAMFRSDEEKSLDHMDPIALGGLHGLSNLVVCCRSCNQRKRDKPFREWLLMLDEPWYGRAEALYVQLHMCSSVAGAEADVRTQSL